MIEEPAILMNILNILLMIIVFAVVIGGFLLFLFLLNYIFKHAKCRARGKFIPM